MADDWRVELDVEGHGGLQHLRDGMRERSVGREARDRLGEGTHVSVDDDRLFAYTETEAQAREAERVLAELAAARDLRVTSSVARWHPEEERWEQADASLPDTPAEHAAERATRDADEEAESRARGFAEWEVRIELAGGDEAEALAARLDAEGLTVVRRSRYVVVPAATEDDAGALADRIRAEAPDAQSVTAEGSAAVAMDELSPFAALSHLLRRG
jgi:hypothetical protein